MGRYPWRVNSERRASNEVTPALPCSFFFHILSCLSRLSSLFDACNTKALQGIQMTRTAERGICVNRGLFTSLGDPSVTRQLNSDCYSPIYPANTVKKAFPPTERGHTDTSRKGSCWFMKAKRQNEFLFCYIKPVFGLLFYPFYAVLSPFSSHAEGRMLVARLVSLRRGKWRHFVQECLISCLCNMCFRFSSLRKPCSGRIPVLYNYFITPDNVRQNTAVPCVT